MEAQTITAAFIAYLVKHLLPHQYFPQQPMQALAAYKQALRHHHPSSHLMCHAFPHQLHYPLRYEPHQLHLQQCHPPRLHLSLATSLDPTTAHHSTPSTRLRFLHPPSTPHPEQECLLPLPPVFVLLLVIPDCQGLTRPRLVPVATPPYGAAPELMSAAKHKLVPSP